MPTYRVELGFNVQGDLGASGAGQTAVWIQADDPADARLKMELATIMEPERYPECRLLPYRAWHNCLVIACDEDGTRAVPEGMAMLGNGETLRL